MDYYCSQPFTKKRFAYTGIQGDYEDDTSSRSTRTITRWIISLEDREIGIVEGVCTGGSRWIQLVQQGSSEKRIEYCLDNKKSFCYPRAIQGHYGGIPIKPKMIGIHIYSVQLERVGSSWGSQSILVSGLIPGGEENDEARQSVFFTALDPFGNNPDEEKSHDDYTIRQKVHHRTYWKHNHDAGNMIKLSRAQDQGLQF